MHWEEDEAGSSHDDEAELELPPSKSQRKREHHDVQRLVETLLELAPARLEAFDLPGDLRERMVAAGRMQRGALRREIRYLARRLADEGDVDAVRETLALITGESRAASARHHRLEHWRDRLIEEGDTALAELVAAGPEVDTQRVRQLVREIRREREAERPPRAFRALYRYLAEVVE
ncbi:MAG: DUF615 domain-containing protein [Ectothiorhodospiraceae bacterium]|nr:DUF615 domain-containing protein [Ectothiorhodospiraceae bacterium]